MRLLLDTHAVLWSLADADVFREPVAAALDDPRNEKLVSIASFWEMAIKVGIGKLAMEEPPETVLERYVRERIATILPIRAVHLRLLRTLPHHHRDPFDRMLVAQALADDLTLVSHDAEIDAYGVRRLW